jgi:hypothetical protein
MSARHTAKTTWLARCVLPPNIQLQRTTESVTFFADARKPPLPSAAEL